MAAYKYQIEIRFDGDEITGDNEENPIEVEVFWPNGEQLDTCIGQDLEAVLQEAIESILEDQDRGIPEEQRQHDWIQARRQLVKPNTAICTDCLEQAKTHLEIEHESKSCPARILNVIVGPCL